MPAEKIAFITGGGDIALAAINYAIAQGYDVYIIGLHQHCNEAALAALNIPEDHILITPPEKLAVILSFLRRQNVRKLIMIGTVKRPSVLALRPDFTALCVLFRNLPIFIGAGDDKLLRILKGELERFSLDLIGLHRIWPDILAPSALRINEDKAKPLHALIKTGWQSAKQHGAADKGQSICIFPDGRIYKEGKDGTNALIQHAATQSGAGGILIKTAKPQQDLDLDMPTIGPETIEKLAAKGYQGLVIETQKTILHKRRKISDACEMHGMFMLSLNDEEASAL